MEKVWRSFFGLKRRPVTPLNGIPRFSFRKKLRGFVKDCKKLKTAKILLLAASETSRHLPAPLQTHFYLFFIIYLLPIFMCWHSFRLTLSNGNVTQYIRQVALKSSEN